MKRITTLLLSMLALFSVQEISAQYTGPGATSRMYTVQEIKANASKLDKSDAIVKVKGFIIEKTSKDTYWLQDTTGKILIEIENKQMPATPFNEKTEVILTGEVDNDLLEGVEIEVEQLQFAGNPLTH